MQVKVRGRTFKFRHIVERQSYGVTIFYSTSGIEVSWHLNTGPVICIQKQSLSSCDNAYHRSNIIYVSLEIYFLEWKVSERKISPFLAYGFLLPVWGVQRNCNCGDPWFNRLIDIVLFYNVFISVRLLTLASM